MENLNILNNLKQYIIDTKIDKIELQHCAWPPAKIPLKQSFELFTKRMRNLWQ